MTEGTHIAALAQQMAALTSRRDEHELAVSMLTLYNNFLNTTSAALHRVRLDGQQWQIKESANLQDKMLPDHWQALPEPLQHYCTNTEHQPTLLGNGMWLPIYRRKQLINLIYLDAANPEPHEQLLIEGLLKIQENFIRLLDDAERDTLTGLRNRRTFDERLFNIIEHKRQPAALALIDIDHFKHINDQWGHIIGDETLLRLAQQMERFFNDSGTCYRYGGEEFAIIVLASQTECAAMLERFRQTVAASNFPPPRQLTISIGFTMITDQPLPTSIIEQADRALYHAKDSGRNRIADFATLQLSGAYPANSTGGDIELF